MKFVAVKSVPYDIELPRPIVTAHGAYARRAGLVLALRDDDGVIAIGDVAPLPGFSPDSLKDCELAVRMLSWQLERDTFTSIEDWEHPGAPPHVSDSHPRPALWFGLATAFADWRGQRRGKSLGPLIATDAARLVPINGLLAESDIHELTTKARALWGAGFRSFKLKVAACDPNLDVARIQAFFTCLPEARVRLDANQGWDIQVARSVLSQIPREQIEFIEEPLLPGSSGSARSLCDEFGLRLALDESADTIRNAQHIVEHRLCEVIVLKPMILGRFYQCHLLAKEAQAAGIEVIYTSSWESDIGIAATLHLAAALGPNPPAMGLSTAGIISDGIVKNPLKIENGYLRVPEEPGLGIELAPEILAQLDCM